MPTSIPTTKEALATIGAPEGPREDPTGTVSLRRSYAREALSRLDQFLSIVQETVVENDALDIEGLASRTRFNAAQDEIGGGTLDQRMDSFRAWANRTADEVILGIRRDEAGNMVDWNRWQNKYVVSAMAKGVRDADRRLRARGASHPDLGPSDELTDLIINQEISPANVARAETRRRTIPALESEFLTAATGTDPEREVIQGALATPAFAERNIRNTLQQLSDTNFRQFQTVVRESVPGLATRLKEEIAEGIAAGQGPEEIAEQAYLSAKQRHQTLTRHRSTMIARTETIRSYNQASLDRYEKFGTQLVQGQQFSTADDERVCPICNGLEGTVFELQQARGIIPAHPM